MTSTTESRGAARHRRRLAAAIALAAAGHRGSPEPLRVLADDRLASIDVAEHVVAAAAYHGIVPLLWDATQHTATAAVLAETTRTEYRTIVARGIRLDLASHAVADVFDAAGIGYALFKGSALANSSYSRPELRFGSDVDILISPTDVRRADEVLHRHGITAVGMSWEARSAAAVSECSYLVGEHGHIDLHWHVMADTPVQRGFHLDPDAMIARAKTISISGRTVQILDPADMFITVATHACFSGAFKLGWMVDIATLVEHPDMDWDEVAARAQASGTRLPLQVMLDRAGQTFGESLHVELADGVWRRTLGATGRLWPVHRGSDQILRGAFIYRATRSTSAASVAALRATVPWDAPLRYMRRRRAVASL